ncbi:MAG: HAD family hydrolase [Spirochaetales bacterium]|nr:HAD family hydrolase [Spirochaetales bacterium]
MSRPEYTWNDLGDEECRLAARVMGEEAVHLAPIPTGLSPRLEKGFSIKAVLFDIYGTLLISGTGDISIAREKENNFSLGPCLKETEFSRLPQEYRDQDLAGPMKEIITAFHSDLKAKGADFPEVDIITIWDRLLNRFKEERFISEDYSLRSLIHLATYHEIISNPVWEMPGAFSLIPALKEKDYRLGIVSNAQFYTPLTLEELSGSTLEELGFELPLCSWSYRILRGKPSPDIFKAPLEKLQSEGINPEEILYVGNDMLNDVYTARLWGCKTALFAGDKRSLRLREGDERCDPIEPDLIITDLAQLKELL